jgi:hypothetical protein
MRQRQVQVRAVLKVNASKENAQKGLVLQKKLKKAKGKVGTCQQDMFLFNNLWCSGKPRFNKRSTGKQRKEKLNPSILRHNDTLNPGNKQIGGSMARQSTTRTKTFNKSWNLLATPNNTLNKRVVMRTLFNRKYVNYAVAQNGLFRNYKKRSFNSYKSIACPIINPSVEGCLP